MLPPGVSSTRQALSAAVVRLSSLESQLAQLESLGGDDDRLALQRRIDIIERAALEPGGCMFYAGQGCGLVSSGSHSAVAVMVLLWL
jgi:hypothetical protein